MLAAGAESVRGTGSKLPAPRARGAVVIIGVVAERVGDAEPLFGDALAGSGGLADPVEPVYSSSLAADVFPDALSASPLPGLPSATPEAWPPPAPNAAPPGGVRPTPGPAPFEPSRSAPSPGRSVPPRTGPPPRPWEQYPPPGAPVDRPPPGPPPFGPPAQLAPPSGRRPTAGTSYQRPATTGSGPMRPPAYLPQNPGMAQIRAALAQARAQAGFSGPRGPGMTAGRTINPTPAAAGNSAARARKKSGASGAWGCLVVLGIVLFSSGAGQKIISLISDLLQRK